MDNEVIITAILVSFAVGTAISWLIFKSRLAIRIADLENKLNNSESQVGIATAELKELLNKTVQLENQRNHLELDNTKLTTELGALSEKLREVKNQNTDLLEQAQRLNVAINESLQVKTVAERDLVNCNNQLNEQRQKEVVLNREVETLQQILSTIKEDNLKIKTQYHEKVRRLEGQQKFIDESNLKLKEAFHALSAEALRNNNESFVSLATSTLRTQITEAKGDLEKKQQAIDSLIKPLNESLTTMNSRVNELEVKRTDAYRHIWEHLDQVKQTAEGLKKETSNLVGALKTSHSRGRYGEIALRRLVEFTGMIDHCHFQEQVSVEDESGKLRPDMVIMLPDRKKLVVDSKAPLAAYLRMFETDDPEKQNIHLNSHITAVKDHLKKLGAKSYWSQFNDAPDFVIMYLHIESSFGTALQAYPQLIEEAFQNRIIIATPTILISILMSIGYSWNQITTIKNIEDIRDAAVELYERSATLIEHFVSVGGSIKSAVTNYNKAVGSLESNFMPQARRINNLSNAYTKKVLRDLELVDTNVRDVALTGTKINTQSDHLSQ